MSPKYVPAIEVLGSTIHLMSVHETVDQIEQWVAAREPACRRVSVNGFHGILEAYKDARVRAVLNACELWVPDGIAPVLLARLYGYHDVQRVPGTDIMREFCRRANQKGYSSYFYGNTEETLAALRGRLKEDYPHHKIAGTFSPPFRPLTPEEDSAVIDRINAARPDILWVGLGAPKQELWIYDRLDQLKVPVAIGVGAAFAFVAGTVQRCPDWVGRSGFEWAYRLLREPKKLWRRDLIDGPRFLLCVARELAESRYGAKTNGAMKAREFARETGPDIAGSEARESVGVNALSNPISGPRVAAPHM